jgi:hypothetical protein
MPLQPPPFFDEMKALDRPSQDFFLKQQSIVTQQAPADATYLVTRANADLTAEVNLGALAAGYLKQTVSVGVATISTTTDVATLTGANVFTNGLNVFGAEVYSVGPTDYTATSTIVGWSSFTSGRKFIYYKGLGKGNWVWFWLEGTSNSTSATFTLPFSASAGATTYPKFGAALLETTDNGVAAVSAGQAVMNGGSNTVTCYVNNNIATNWTALGTKIVAGQFWVQAT